MELSSLIGKPVLSAAGETIGYVKNVYLNKAMSAPTAYVCVDGNEAEFFLAARSAAFDGECIRAGRRLAAPSGIPSPIGKTAFDRNGNSLGRICDVIPDGKESGLVAACGSAKIFLPVRQTAIGDVVICYPSAKKGEKSAKSDPNMCQNAPQVDKMESNSAQNAKRVDKTQPESAQNARPTDEESAALYAFNLLGRTVRRDVSDGAELLAAAGETVTPDLIGRARASNRLLALAASILTE